MPGKSKGDTVALADGNGDLSGFYEYDAWGNTMTEAKKTGADNPYGYWTKEWDEKSGLYYFGARYYSPEIGKWTQRDPVGTTDGLNLYAYVRNAAPNALDPWGLEVTFGHIKKAICLLEGMGLIRKDAFRWIRIGPTPSWMTVGGEALTIPDWMSPYSWIYINRHGTEDLEVIAQTVLHELGHVALGSMDKKTHAAWEQAVVKAFNKKRDEMSKKLTNQTCCLPGTGKRYYLSEYGALLKRCKIGDCAAWIRAGGKPAQ